MKAFKNQPLSNFLIPKNKKNLQKSIEQVRKNLGKTYPLIIGGKDLTSSQTFDSLNPSNPTEIVGTLQEATLNQAELAIESALKTFSTWQYTSAKQRATFLFKMASRMRQKKYELCAWLILEIGKNWYEADAEVAEAIDFLEYYGREIIRLTTPPKLAPIPHEKNEFGYIPLGVGAIITPWNFPLAILAGMTTSAIVTGNTVVLKPSEYAPVIAHQFMKIVNEVKVPPGVINLLTGQGAAVGKYLVSHPKIRFISFTGSKAVGLEINETASKIAPGQKWIKRVIAEMGGKDAIIVDRECDLEDAVTGVIKSAFGYQGQKCSACSRAIVDETIYDSFIEKLIEKTKTIHPDHSEKPDTRLGPLISQAAVEKAERYIHIGKQEGKLLLGGKVRQPCGYFVEPTIFGDVSPKARIAQEEIFAPVLSVIRSKDFDNAIAIANDTEYGLTGSFYTKNPQKIKKGLREFHVGNLYVNRGCTGALVGATPFGGFNMSGTDSKAGGPDYLLLFMQGKTISQKYKTEAKKK